MQKSAFAAKIRGPSRLFNSRPVDFLSKQGRRISAFIEQLSRFHQSLAVLHLIDFMVIESNG